MKTSDNAMYVNTQENVPEAAPTQRTQIAKGKQGHPVLLSPLWLCLLLAFGIRVFLIIHTHGMIEGDESLVGIQAIRILRGDFPVYFYNQPYMGSLEAYFAALLFAFFGSSVWALRLVGTLLSVFIVWLTWRLAGALAESAKLPQIGQLLFKTVAALCAAIPPLYDGVLELHMLGGYIETFALIMLLLLSAFQLTRRWRAGASYRELIRRWVGIGFVTGLGLWVDPLIISAILAAALWIVGHCLLAMWRGRGDKRGLWWRPAEKLLLAFVAVPASLLGASPALAWGATHQWANVAYIFQLSGDISFPQKMINTLQVAQSFGSCISPRLIGGALPGENALLMQPVEGPLSANIHTGLFFVGLISIAALVLLLLWACLRPHSRLAPVRQLMGLPALFAFCSIFLFCINPTSLSELHDCSRDWVGRYAAPVMLALPFFFATAFTLGWLYLRSKEKSIHAETTSSHASTRRFRRPLYYYLIIFSQSLLLLLLPVFLGAHALTYRQTSSGETFQSNYCPVEAFDNGPILAYLQEQHIHYFWANNFLAYPLVFKSKLTIIGSDPLTMILATIPNNRIIAIDRIPSYTEAVSHADRPSMLFVIPHNDTQPQIFQALDKLHVTYRAARFYAQPGYDVLVVTPVSRTVSPLELKQINVFICVTS